MAVGLPNWWHSIALLAILFSCSVKVQLSFAIAIEHPFRFGPLPSPQPEPAPEPPPESPPILTRPPPYSSFFNLTPPVPDFHLLPSNHDRSLYMPAQHNRIPILTEPIFPIDGDYPISYFSGSILPNRVDYYPAPSVVPEISQTDPAESVEHKPYWEYLRPASPITSIVQQVLANYKSHESPDENNPDPTTVTVSVHILAVASINVIQMEYTVDLYLRQQWVDSRLAWERVPHLAHYKDYVLLTAHKQRLWLPDLFFRNGKRGYRHEMSVPNDLIRVHPNGSVLYSQKITMILSCSMYLHLYPMDHQECQMNIGSYGYTVDELKFVWRQDNPVTVAEKLQLLEFDSPRSASTRDCTKNGTTSTGTYSCLLLTLPLQRLVSSYLVTTYIPEVLIVMVSWLGFWIDVRAVPARISLGLLTLLGLLTEGSSVGSKLPRFTYVKAIDVWIIACLLFVIAALAEFAAAYMLAPQEKQNEWDEELRLVIRGILEKKLGSSRCCCCYTKSTNHKPVLFTSRSGHSFRPGEDVVSERPVENKSLSKRHLHGKKSLELNTSSSFIKCGVCDSLQPDCCTCPLCERLQCPKAPRSVAHQRKTSTSDTARATNTCTSNNTDRRHIVICEPSPTFRSRTSGPKRIGAGTGGISAGSFPKKSALKVSRPSSSPASSLYERNRHETRRSCRLNRSYLSRQTSNDATNVPPSNTEIRRKRPFFSSRSPFCFCRLKCGTPPSHSKRLPLGQSAAESAILPLNRKSAQKQETYDSEVDAYSRFLFPACFVLFNCCYWLFYMVISDGNPPKPS